MVDPNKIFGPNPLLTAAYKGGITADEIIGDHKVRSGLLRTALKKMKKASVKDVALIRESRAEGESIIKMLGWQAAEKHEVDAKITIISAIPDPDMPPAEDKDGSD